MSKIKGDFPTDLDDVVDALDAIYELLEERLPKPAPPAPPTTKVEIAKAIDKLQAKIAQAPLVRPAQEKIFEDWLENFGTFAQQAANQEEALPERMALLEAEELRKAALLANTPTVVWRNAGLAKPDPNTP